MRIGERVELHPGPATCRHCGEQAGSTGSLSGLVHRWGPKDHQFEPLPTAEQSNAVVERMIAAETTILSTPATHPCDACGGRGTAWPCDCEPLDCEHYPAVCPVCLGRGEHPDRMPARDALADAETLQTVGPRIIGREPYTVIEAIRFARAAFRAVPGLRGGK